MPIAHRVNKTPWTAEGQEKHSAVREMFAEIAPNYDVCNSVMSLSLHHKWRAAAVEKLQLKPGASALDVCCGTGDFLPPLRNAIGPSGRLVGVDFCLPMLARAVAKKVDDAAMFSVGDACNLPILSESFDGVSVGWGIRNVPDIDGAHSELFRVLKSGGRFVSLDMAEPRNLVIRTGSRFFCGTMLPLLGTLFGKRKAYTYLPKSTQRFKTREELKSSLEAAGFTGVGYRDLLFGNICIHWGQKP